MAETTTVNPPSFQLPYLQYGMEQARGLYETGGPNYFPNKTYVPFSGQTEAALGLTENRALMGSPVDRAMQSYITGTLGNTGMGQPAFNYYSSMMNQFSGSPYGTPQMSQPLQNPMAQPPSMPAGPMQFPESPSTGQPIIGRPMPQGPQTVGKYGQPIGRPMHQGIRDESGRLMPAPGEPNTPEFNALKAKRAQLQEQMKTIPRSIRGGSNEFGQNPRPSITSFGPKYNPTQKEIDDLARYKSILSQQKEIDSQISAMMPNQGFGVQLDSPTLSLEPQPILPQPMPSQPMANAVPAPAVPRPLPPNPFNLNAAQNQIDATLSGNYLNANPYLDQAFDLASKKVTDAYTKSVIPALNASFAGAGGSGSGIQRELALDASERLGTSLGSLASDIYGQNYQNERARQADAARLAGNLYSVGGQDVVNRANAALRAREVALNNAINQGKLGLDAASGYGNLLSQIGTLQGRAAQLAPTASALDYANIDRLGGVGQAVEGKANQILQDQINRFNYYQNRPEQNLANYMGYITGNYGQDQTTNFDKGSSALNALGGASVLGSLFNEIGGQGAGWWGAGLGALGGLLAS